jgi:beta-glucosidase
MRGETEGSIKDPFVFLEEKNMNKRNTHLVIFTPIMIILLAVGIISTVMYSNYSQVIQGALATDANIDEEYREKVLNNSKQVNISLMEEGATLLKNDNNVLPLSVTKNKKINVYGILSAHHYKGSTGSSTADSAINITFKDALEKEGFEVNTSIWNMLASKELGYSSSSEVGLSVSGQYELPLETYENTLSFEEAKAYSDVALIMFGSNGGEGSDGDESESSNSLQLGNNEIALLAKLKAEGFKVVAMINGSYNMEMGPLVEYADSILWIGGIGIYGLYGVCSILSGNTNPSGHLVDTFVYDEKTSSSYYTSNVPTINSGSTTTYLSQYVDTSNKILGSYTNYNEGIYVGYKWYETADKEKFWNSQTANDVFKVNSYEDVVAYPFGYGLSYTSFNEKLIKSTSNDQVIDLTVEVTNTGNVAGKTAAEIYVSKPYTDGQNMEISEVELIDFTKTKELQPGETETISFSVNNEDLASYDSCADNGKGSYVLESGTYSFFLGDNSTGAHCWKTYENDSDHQCQIELNGKEYSGDNKRSSDNVEAHNQLETTLNDTKVSCNDSTSGYKTLSRSNSFSNWNKTISKESNSNQNITLVSGNLYDSLKANYGNGTYSNFNIDHLVSVAETTNSALNSEKKYNLSDLYTNDEDGNSLYSLNPQTNEVTIKEVSYDDSRWDYLLSQMSIDEIEQLIGHGGYGTIAIDSIGKLQAYDNDGPTGYSNFLKASLSISQDTTGFCSEPIMAATYNKDLIYQFGQAVGLEGNAFNNNGWYAPGMNIHSSPFEGRTGEYFSEDSCLTGMMASKVSEGALSKGVYTYAKHFAFNELETHRSDAMNCWMDEQTAREIYLRPFEIGIKDQNITGLMTSFMFFNGQWCGGNYNIVHNIVREEWNFQGIMNTDLAGSSSMGAERAICAGTDMLLGTSYNATNKNMAWERCDTIKTREDGICAMKTAAKHILYTYARAAVHREEEVTEKDNTLSRALIITLQVVSFGGAAVFVCLIAYELFFKKYVTKIEVVKKKE